MAGPTFWVSVNGSASGDGSQHNPFNSIELAQQAVRAVLQTGPQQDIVVKIGGGTYQLDQALTFTAADSGNNGHVVRYEAVDGETPVLSGARAVTGWTATSDPGLGLPPGMQLWKAHVGTGIDTRQLYIDGERATRAESNPASTLENPIYPEAFRPTVDDIPGLSGIQYIVSDKNPGNWRDPTTWTNVGDIEAVIYDQWKMMSVPLQAVLAPSPDIPSLIGEISSTPVGMIVMNDQASAWTNANLYRSLPTGNETAGQQWVYLNGDFATNGIKPGMTVTGDNILPGTTVDYLVPELNVVALSQAPTATATNVSLTFSDPSTGEPVVEHAGIWSFWRVTKFENAFQFLDQANEWYLDRSTGDLYLVGGPGFDPNGHDIQLPVLEQLLVGNGAANLTFDGLSFKYATWLAPNGAQGYVSDQSGALVVGGGHEQNLIGHVKDVVRTPGNISFANASNITFSDGHFSHLGGVGVDFLPGAQNNRITNSIFEDISSAAIQFGGVSAEDARPGSDAGVTRSNAIVGNVIKHAGAEFVDAAGIFIGFAQNTNIEDNFISDVPWAGIAMGWGWGLMDQGGFAGLPGADPGMWGPGGSPYTTPTIMQGNRIVGNYITRFLDTLWDGGAVYTTGFQGTSLENGTYIGYNYFYGKHASGGGNVIYTDGGTRYVTVEGNILLGNPQGAMNFGAPFSFDDPLNNLLVNSFAIMPLVNGTAYGGEIGGCVTYGDIAYIDNLWQDLWTTNPFSRWNFNPTDWPNNPLFYDPAPQHWTPSLSFLANRILDSSLFDNLLVFTRPSAASVGRVDTLDGAVSFGIQSMRDGAIQMLLQNAEGGDANALPWGVSSDAAWLASEGKALGSIAAVSGSLQAGVWLPTASLDGNALALTSVELGANSLLATFEGGYQADFMLGGTRSILNGDVGEHTSVVVKRLASQNNGLAFYEADRHSGAVTLNGETITTSDARYFQAALAKAQADGLVLGPSDLPGYGRQAVLNHLPIDEAKNYGVLVILNNNTGTMFSSYANANPNGDVQIVTLGQQGRGVTYGIEDVSVSSGHSDRDYNDLIVSFVFNDHLDPL
jgi:hypothetical protein